MNKKVAYFCMEYGLDESFRIYSGGLGILAGDILKAACDEGKPMTGIGILWRQGYVSQKIDDNGKVFDSYYEYQYPFLQDTEKTVEVSIKDQVYKLKIWKCEQFNNVPLYLLDANVEGNPNRLITSQLYGWFGEERIAQEIILGVGGVRALEALGIDVDIYHFNDSHPVIAGLELIREKMSDGLDFEQAYANTRKQIVFTTHTPVVAGNESYSLDMLKYMGVYDGLSFNQMRKIGSSPFGMTIAGLRLSYIANGVAELHGQTARKMWKGVKDASKIIAVTNGVHNATWQDAQMAKLKGEELFLRHKELKSQLFLEIEKKTGKKLDSDVLTIGFGRRAAPYKRSDLIFRGEYANDLLKAKKIQLIFSGKAHPNDLNGKEIIQNIVKKTELYPDSVVFLQDYDMSIGKLLTRGCDVWLNNPIRPMEASGTSGMKAAMNGVLNLSVLDGWWPEGCVDGETGWQIGAGYEGEDCDQIDGESLKEVLMEKVIPKYYDNNADWVTMMENSIAMATDRFSAARMVNDYYEKMYNLQPE